jgi:hypothetical protein
MHKGIDKFQASIKAAANKIEEPSSKNQKIKDEYKKQKVIDG